MTGRNRLHKGGRLNRAWPVHFTFDGRPLRGFPGDTLASALLANDVHCIGRRPEDGRPLGIVSAGLSGPTAIVGIGTGADAIPNAAATTIPLTEGLAAFSQSGLPHDGAAIPDRLRRLIPDGTEWGRGLASLRDGWATPPWIRAALSPAIRGLVRLRGLSDAADPDRYDRRFARPDIAVVGAGPAGLMAAWTAARAGACVLLAESDPLPGGCLLSEPWPGPRFGDGPSDDWIDAVWAELAGNPKVTLLPATTAVDAEADGSLTLLERVAERPDAAYRSDPFRHRLWRVRAARTVLATGVRGRSTVFPGNDRPGVMQASAVRSYVHRWAVLPGERAVVVASTSAGYRLALDLAETAGAAVAVIDPRVDPTGPIVDRVRRAGIDVLAGSAIAETAGYARVSGVTVRRLDGAGGFAPDRRTEIACDLIAMDGGTEPEAALLTLMGGQAETDAIDGAFRIDPATIPDGVSVVGGLAGATGWAEALAHGAAAARQALADLDFDTRSCPPQPTTTADPEAPETAIRSPIFGTRKSEAHDGTWDVPADRPRDRSPVVPIPFGALAGSALADSSSAVRRGAFHDRHRAAGAAFEIVAGLWRPMHHAGPGVPVGGAVEVAQSEWEAASARSGIGLCDGADTDRWLAVGPDAIGLLDRFVSADLRGLAVGHWRPTLFLSDDGRPVDEGRILCEAPDRFVVETGASGCAAMRTAVRQGGAEPASRAVLLPLSDTVAALTLVGAGVPGMWARLFGPGTAMPTPGRFVDAALSGGPTVRVVAAAGGPVPELSLRCDRAACDTLWDRLTAADIGALPVGALALDALRIAAGHPRAGAEIDGHHSADDLGLVAWIGPGRTPLPDPVGPHRQLVGVEAVDGTTPIPPGGLLFAAEPDRSPSAADAEGAAVGVAPLGTVTSAARHPGTGRPVGLALLAEGRARIGLTLTVDGLNGPVPVRIIAPGQWSAGVTLGPPAGKPSDAGIDRRRIAGAGPTATDDGSEMPRLRATVTPAGSLPAVEIAVWDGPAFAAASGAPWPTPPAPRIGESADGSDGSRLATLGSDRFLLTGSPDGSVDFDAVSSALDGIGCAVDRTMAWTVLDLTGPDARAVLASGCGERLDDAAWPVGRIAILDLAAVPVAVLRRADGPGDAWVAKPSAAKPQGLAVLSPAAPELRPAADGGYDPRGAADGTTVPAFRLWVAAGYAAWLHRWLRRGGVEPTGT